MQIIFHAWKIPIVCNAPYEALVVGMEVVQLMKVPQKMQIYRSGLNLDCFQNPRNMKRDNIIMTNFHLNPGSVEGASILENRQHGTLLS
jgi:hypothetical protein